MAKKTALVISAHAADFVWRAGGAIALHQKLGYDVTGELVVWTSKVEARVLAGMRPEVRLIAA